MLCDKVVRIEVTLRLFWGSMTHLSGYSESGFPENRSLNIKFSSVYLFWIMII